MPSSWACPCHSVSMCAESMDHGDGLLRIGVFSALARISVRMLRYYQDHEVLVPECIDPFNGHRYYRSEQLADAELLVSLREAGFSIERAAGVLRHRDSCSIEDAIAQQRDDLEQAREELHRKLAALTRISTILKGRPDMTEVTRTTIPAMYLVGLRKTIAAYSDEGELWAQLNPLLVEVGASFPAGGICGATYHSSEDLECDHDVEVWAQVTGPVAATGPVTCRLEPERDIITATLHGDYAQMSAVSAKLGAYISEHNLQTGSMFNIYRVSPAQNPDPSSWVTEVCFEIVDV